MAADRVSVEGHEDNVLKRCRDYSKVNVFDVVLEYFLHVKHAIFDAKMALPCRMAVDRVKLLNICRVLSQSWVGNNLEQ